MNNACGLGECMCAVENKQQVSQKVSQRGKMANRSSRENKEQSRSERGSSICIQLLLGEFVVCKVLFLLYLSGFVIYHDITCITCQIQYSLFLIILFSVFSPFFMTNGPGYRNDNDFCICQFINQKINLVSSLCECITSYCDLSNVSSYICSITNEYAKSHMTQVWHHHHLQGPCAVCFDFYLKFQVFMLNYNQCSRC